MRLIPAIILLSCISFHLSAQNDTTSNNGVPADTSYWSKEIKLNLNFSQVSLTNWSSGGNSSVSIGALTDFNLNYQKNKDVWNSRLNMAYGVLRQGDEDEPFVKTDDNIILTSKYSRQLKKKIFMSAMIDFRTQFYEGTDVVDDEVVVISRFMSPGFLLGNIGFTYRHKKIFSATLSPLSSKTTIVTDTSLVADYGVESGKVRFQSGVNFTAAVETPVMENVDFSSNLNLFSAYTDLTEIDVNWETLLTFKINKFLTSSFSSLLIYDEDVKSKEIVVNEATGDTRLAAGVQFKSVLNIGLAFTF